MIGRILKVAFIIFIVAFVSYIFYFNQAPADVKIAPNVSWRLPMAVTLIVVFCGGALTAALIALVGSIGMRLRMRREVKSAGTIREHRRLIMQAREQLALGNWEAARAGFKKIIDRDPDDIPARVLLAETFKREGRLREALAVLEDARVEQKKNIELLLAASDINARLGNATAAHDNAALVLKIAPRNRFALQRLVQSAKALGRWDEAIDYQQQLIRIAPAADVEKRQDELAQLELRRVLEQGKEDKEALRKALQELRRKYRSYPPLLGKLAESDQEAGDNEAASKTYLKLFQDTEQVEWLRKAAFLWLKAEDPGKAISVVRNAASRSVNPEVNLFFAGLLLHLSMIEEARKVLNGVPEENLPPQILNVRRLLDASLLSREGSLEQANGQLFLMAAERIEADPVSRLLSCFMLPGFNQEADKGPVEPEPYLMTHWYDEV